MMSLDSEADLLQIVRALRPADGFPGVLHGREQQREEYADDGDYHQQFDEREAARLRWSQSRPHGTSSAKSMVADQDVCEGRRSKTKSRLGQRIAYPLVICVKIGSR